MSGGVIRLSLLLSRPGVGPGANGSSSFVCVGREIAESCTGEVGPALSSGSSAAGDRRGRAEDRERAGQRMVGNGTAQSGPGEGEAHSVRRPGLHDPCTGWRGPTSDGDVTAGECRAGATSSQEARGAAGAAAVVSGPTTGYAYFTEFASAALDPVVY